MAAKKKREHAILSASSAKKWLNCPPSARLEDTLPDSQSDFSREGTLAHDICELKLHRLFTDQAMSERTFNTRMNKLKKHELYHPEMERYTDIYVEYIQLLTYGFPTVPYVAVEKTVEYEEYAPEGFGKCDCIVVTGTTCHIIDFKYGKGLPVYADNNVQMSLYALGAISTYGMIYPIEKVVMTIIQPRLDNISEWETSAESLIQWGNDVVKPKADIAFKGEGDYCQGSWCDEGFCRAATLCRQRMSDNMKLEEYVNPVTGDLDLPPLIDNKTVGAILKSAQNLSKWVKKLDQYALKELVAGRDVPGWKIVEGRSNREFTDQDAAFEALIKAGYKEELLYDKVPLALTKAEKQISKEDYDAIMAPYIFKPQGSPTLALESDKRPVYEKKANVEEAFGGSNEYKEGTQS